MKTLKTIYVEYEIGEIYPENLPNELKKLPSQFLDNKYLLKISNLKNPTKRDLNDYLLKAFSIDNEKEMTQMEKVEILINRWENGEINSEKLYLRLKNLNIESWISSKPWDYFLSNLLQSINGKWISSDNWDYWIEELKNEFNENNYSEFLIKTSG